MVTRLLTAAGSVLLLTTFAFPQPLGQHRAANPAFVLVDDDGDGAAPPSPQEVANPPRVSADGDDIGALPRLPPAPPQPADAPVDLSKLVTTPLYSRVFTATNER